MTDTTATRESDSRRRRRPKSAATRRRILEAAAKVLRQKGYAGARLADIAAAAGTQAGSLYYHFPSREALVEEVLREGVDMAFRAVVDRVEGLGPEAGPRQRLAAAITAHAEAMLELGDFSFANIRIFGQLPGDLRTRHLAEQRAYGDYWRGLLEEARQAGLIAPDHDLSATRMLLLGMLNWTVEWYRPGPLSAADLARQAAETVLDGLLREPPP
ncbi:MAG: TetR/AcrR family transcriptional regulator [Alphaproteobacteria bacterium]|jgi:AcrR family transcriptional regulator|nr:TetR/AcrR family transcriptional regulator [Alphaproteobacteria bacterium]MDP6565790.1 TetR/AcrR family transcriptional regulator [Alphaproteobacteria bacterium]MDP6816234.1 TetR/AcrR family transcriptional regulator [Alphaproteobacteria bacterium]